MQGCEWAFAPFVQMERDFLRDIIFRLFLCLSYSHLRREVGMFHWGRDTWLQTGCSSQLQGQSQAFTITKVDPGTEG